MIRLFTLFGFCTFFNIALHSQISDPKALVTEIAYYSDIVINAEDGTHRTRANEDLLANIDLFLNTPGSFHTSLDSISWLYVLHGNDFRLVSWQLRITNEEFKYGAFIQWEDRHVYFKDSRPFINGSAYTTYTPAAWYGAVYYKMIPFEREKMIYYILLGYNAENSLLNTKVADVLDLTSAQPLLGVPVFTGAGDPQTRLMVSYADISPARVQFDEKLNGILIDHVSTLAGVGPNGESLPIPDGSLDAWILKKGNWVFEEEVYDVKSKDPLMTKERKDKKEEKDIMGRPKKN